MPTPAGSASAPPTVRKTVAENVKDTLESLVVAFILAFVFRAFIVEAFIIPTGSMAPTLYGEQFTNTCPICGYEYAVGVSQPGPRRSPDVRVQCPNCNMLELKAAELARSDSGDRILVQKWPFDIGGQWLGPHRWDVTVFKDPRDGTTNFIKRLVGLPGEVLEIIDGDIYAVKIAKLKPEVLAEFDRLRAAVYQERLMPSERRGVFLERYRQLNREVLPLLRIERKLPHRTRAQDSLWFTVYDHDFLPVYENVRAGVSDHVGWEPVGAAAALAWNASQREITFRSKSSEPLAIRFAGKPIDDFYAYNNDSAFERSGRQPVGDLRLRFEWFPDSATGGLSLTMNRDRDEFTADIGADGSVRVVGVQPEIATPGHRQVIGEKQLTRFPAGQAVRVEFINLDYRVALFINGEEVIASTDKQYAPQLEQLQKIIEATERGQDGPSEVEVQPSSVRIAAHEMNCRLRHVVLERDVYYRSQKQGEPYEQGDPYKKNSYYLWPGWATAGFPMLLRPTHYVDGRRYEAEYFMLGDNSPASKDSRLWWEIGPHLRHLNGEYQVGTVPEDQLIGKAFFVYWPAGYRPSWAPAIGLIPNVGQMRWIR